MAGQDLGFGEVGGELLLGSVVALVLGFLGLERGQFGAERLIGADEKGDFLENVCAGGTSKSAERSVAAPLADDEQTSQQTGDEDEKAFNHGWAGGKW